MHRETYTDVDTVKYRTRLWHRSLSTDFREVKPRQFLLATWKEMVETVRGH
jgi:hypothetical protein